MEWNQYYSDLKIPKNWVNVSYSNDLLPSFTTSDSDDSYQVFIDSHDLSVRKSNTEELTGQSEVLMKRFAVVKDIGEGQPPVFVTDDFDELLAYVTSSLDQLTEEYTRWGKKHGIELCSADEMCTENFTDEQKKYLKEFIERWQRAESL